MKSKLIFSALLLTSSAAFAQIAVHPVEVDLREKRVATISLTNQSDTQKTFEVDLDESAGVIFSPRVFTVEPGKTRRIKYAVKTPVEPGQQRYARTAINDISPAVEGKIETRIGGSLPVFVGNGKPELKVVDGQIKNVGTGTARVTMIGEKRNLVYLQPGQVLEGAKPGQPVYIDNEQADIK